MKTSKQIRQDFISFFENHEHRYVRSAPVVPIGDPTLLFTNAGMNQFKDVFLGHGSREYDRAVNSQKCIRASGKHNDLEDVGRDNYHHTFFEMLGNWSFGDYFKEEAIRWAWKLCVDHWGLPSEQLWATVFEGAPQEGVEADTEAEQIWKDSTSIPKQQVLRCSKKDNFWEMGEWGPCGPCSEIHMDLGEGTCPLSSQHECAVNVDGCWRFVELWNLVFIQYNRLPTGDLETLPAKHVDTGMGLERICRVLQGVNSNYETDLFVPILDEIGSITGKRKQAGEVEVAFHVIADHIRALSYAIADGALPSNEGRGYVLRRMLRRATRFGLVLDMQKPFIYQLVPTVAEVMGEAFPELPAQLDHVASVIQAEEESFGATLDRGIEIFYQMTEQPNVQSSNTLSGEDAFKLYDTYGFPIDLTKLMCEEQKLHVDEAAFEACMEAQRNKARESAKFHADVDEWITLQDGEHSDFVGYHVFELDTEVSQYSKPEAGRYHIILKQTPFYPESGGQVADQGSLTQGEHSWKVLDVRKDGDRIVHVCEGSQDPNSSKIHASIHETLRLATTANHTTTHLMHAALKNVLGDHAQQAGSVVHPEYLRFDFTHFEKLTDEQIEDIETQVNHAIRKNIDLNIYQTEYDQAIEDGITALFGEKYDDQVRVVKIGSVSSELCGGCHVRATGDIGSFKITSEGSIATGVRRIIGITGAEAEKLAREESKIVTQLKQRLNTDPNNIVASVQQLISDRKKLEKELQHFKKQLASQDASSLTEKAEIVDGVSILAEIVQADSSDALKGMGDSIRQNLDPAIAVLASVNEDRALLLCVVSDQLVKKGIKAGNIINEVAAIADGRGGGKPHMAQAGAKSPEKVPDAIKKAPEIIKASLV